MRILPFALLALFLFLFATALPAAPLTPEEITTLTNQAKTGTLQERRDALRKLAIARAPAPILDLLKDADPQVRTVGLESADAFLTAEVLDALINLMLHDPDQKVRYWTTLRMKSYRKTPVLKPRLPDPRTAAIEAKLPELRAAMIQAMDDKDEWVSIEAIRYFFEETPAPVDLYMNVARDKNKLPRTRGAAAMMLGRAKAPEAYPVLLQMTTEGDTQASFDAITALGDLGDQKAAQPLLEIMLDAKRHPQATGNASYALAKLAAPELLDTLLKIVKDPNPTMREHACTALSGYSDPRVGEALTACLQDRDRNVRSAASRALTTAKAPQAVLPLIEQAKSTDLTQRLSALDALAAIGDPRAFDTFAAAVTDKEQMVRTAAIRGLGAIHDARGVDVLLPLLQGTDQNEKDRAVTALCALGDPRAIGPILKDFQQQRKLHPNNGWSGNADTAVRIFLGADRSSLADSFGIFRETPVSIAMKLTDPAQFTMGDVPEVLMTVYNKSDKALLVSEIDPTSNAGEEPITLSSRVSGDLTRTEGGDGYAYKTQPPHPSQTPLHIGLLLPGQAMQVKLRYRAISYNERFTVQYYSADQPYDGTPASLLPLKVYLPVCEKGKTDPPASYVPFTDSAWQELCRTATRTALPGPAVPPRAVVVDLGTALKPTESPLIANPSFGNKMPIVDVAAINAAARLSNRDRHDITLAYSQALAGYIVVEPERRWLLKDAAQQEIGQPLPSFPLELTKDIDCGPVQVKVGDAQKGTGPAGWKLWDTYPVSYGDGVSRSGEFITLDKTTFPAFLAKLQENHGTIAMQENLFRGRLYMLNVPKKGN